MKPLHVGLREDERFLEEAMKEARESLAAGEVPVGAVLVVEGDIVGRGHNSREASQNPLAHAELQAIHGAAGRLHSWRIGGTLYVTLEPCPMCAGAIILARIGRLVYGTRDPKGGAAGSVVDLFRPGLFNHTVQVTPGVLGGECAALLQGFFANLRRDEGNEGGDTTV